MVAMPAVVASFRHFLAGLGSMMKARARSGFLSRSSRARCADRKTEVDQRLRRSAQRTLRGLSASS